MTPEKDFNIISEQLQSRYPILMFALAEDGYDSDLVFAL